MANHDILTGVRSLLLLFPDLTDVVSDRIRPERPHSEDGNLPQIILELPNADQDNVLDRSCALIRGELQVRIRSTDITQTNQLAEIIRTQNANPSEGLDGYAGTAGDGDIVQCERRGFSSGVVLDDDGDETDLYENLQVYDLWYLVSG